MRAGFLAVAKNGKWGVIDLKGTEIIPLKYDRVRKLEGAIGTLALARIEQNELEGIIDLRTQKEVLPCKYEFISDCANGLLAAALPNEKQGCYYNVSGEKVFGDAAATNMRALSPKVLQKSAKMANMLCSIKRGSLLQDLNTRIYILLYEEITTIQPLKKTENGDLLTNKGQT